MSELRKEKNYIEWLKSLKEKFSQVQIKAAVRVNTEFLGDYERFFIFGKTIYGSNRRIN